MACLLSRTGHSLSQVAQALEVDSDTVLCLIARKTQLDKQTIEAIFNSMEEGVSINKLPPCIPVEALKEFVPEATQTDLSRDSEIEKCSLEGLPVLSIVGVPESEAIKVLNDDLASAKERLPSAVVPVVAPRDSEESKSPAVIGKILRKKGAAARIEPIVEELPQYIYSFKENSSVLFQTALSTGKTRKESVDNHTFKVGSVWCEVAGGDIYFTGGRIGWNVVDEAVRVSGSSLEVNPKAPMLSARCDHGSVYHMDYLYAIGGLGSYQKCERLLVREDRWEALQTLPRECFGVSVAVVRKTQSLYALGVEFEENRYLGLVQRLSLRSLTWEVMPIKLPGAALDIVCFRHGESKVWFVVSEKLYCLNALTEGSISFVRKVGNLVSKSGPSYYLRGNLYCPILDKAAKKHVIGSI